MTECNEDRFEFASVQGTRPIVAEFYQRCFGQELPESSVNVALS